MFVSKSNLSEQNCTKYFSPIFKAIVLFVCISIVSIFSFKTYVGSKDHYVGSMDQIFPETMPNQPTAVFTIGLSGSGKSTWARQMEGRGWKRIDSDELNVNILKKLRMEGQVAEEINSIPNESNSRHLYSLRNRGLSEASRLVDEAILQNQSFIFDALGLSAGREKLEAELRAKGYQIWHVVFTSKDFRINRYNLFKREREREGGFASFRELPVLQRCNALDRMYKSQLIEFEKYTSSDKVPDLNVSRIFRMEVKDFRGEDKSLDPCTD